MTYTVMDQILGYLVMLKRGIDFKTRLRFYPKWQETGAFIHIHKGTATYIEKRLPGGGVATGFWARTEESLHTIKEDGAEVYVSFILGSGGARISMFRRQTPGKKRPYYSLLGTRDEVYSFLYQLGK